MNRIRAASSAAATIHSPAIAPALAAALALTVLLALPAAAAQSDPVATAHDTASLISESDAFTAGHELRLGLRLQLAPGWHTYWSNPGDAGAAATIAITASGAASGSAGTIDWPAPQRLPDGPLMSYGYTGDVLLPVTLKPLPAARAEDARGTLHLQATADWLACANVCVPEHGVFRLDLPPGAPAPSRLAALFAAARARQPLPSPFTARLAPDGVLSLSGSGLGPRSVHDAWFLPATAGLIDQAAAQPVSLAVDTVAIRLRPTAALAADARLDGLVVLRDAAGNESVLSVSAARGPAPASHGHGWATLPRLMLFALLGGIVLNLMPCVFPVLAMKALALSRMSGAARPEMRRSAWFYTAGVLAAFAVLGGVMLGLRAAGSLAGWGFQFQSPLFVAGTCWLLFGVGLNLAGLFEIGAGVTGLGQELAARRGHAGDFATGLLAVLVATPCTAPFMGVAVAGALSAAPAAGMAVFLALGLGLALPYVLLASLPGLAARLPRPGNWMLVLRQALSFPIFASCVWLAWVTAIEGGDRGVLVLGSGMVLLALAGWLLGLSQRPAMRRPAPCRSLAGLCILAALALLPGLSAARPAATSSAGTEAFSQGRLAALRAQGRPVFVDMTAAWCVTCLVNERIALAPASVRDAFAAHRVATLRGDWTRRDPAITGFLREHGREGVPFYVYYPPGGGEGRVLPQILTAGAILHEVDGSL